VGEIVVTPIHNRGWGLVRFGTGDMSSIVKEPCPCGRTSAKIAGFLGRTGDAVKVRGMFIVARQAEQLISSFEAVSRFQIIVDRQANRDEINLKLELKDDSGDKGKLIDDVNRKFQDICRVKLDNIVLVSPGTIPEPYQPIQDVRKWE
jgi:phenylacetate-CoA ligase